MRNRVYHLNYLIIMLEGADPSWPHWRPGILTSSIIINVNRAVRIVVVNRCLNWNILSPTQSVPICDRKTLCTAALVSHNTVRPTVVEWRYCRNDVVRAWSRDCTAAGSDLISHTAIRLSRHQSRPKRGNENAQREKSIRPVLFQELPQAVRYILINS